MTSMIKRFGRNTRGRDLVIGDVHGCFDKLRLSLRRIGFDPDEGDRLFCVGDLVDRGEQSEDVLKWLSRPWFQSVMGNHEQMAMMFAGGDMDAYTLTLNGGAWLVGKTPHERFEYVSAFMDLPLVIELETLQGIVALVHANCPSPTWEGFKDAMAADDSAGVMAAAVWDRGRVDNGDQTTVEGVRAVVVGHTPVDFAQWFGNVLHIDTGAWINKGRTERNFAIVDAASLMVLDSAAPKPVWSEVLG